MRRFRDDSVTEPPTEPPALRTILPIFGRSPFKPFQAHMEKVRETMAGLDPFFRVLLAGDRERVREIRKRITKLEHEADLLKNDIRDNLPKSFFMPVDRRDLLNLLHQQDTLADTCEDLVIVATLRDPLPLPAPLHEPLLALLGQSIATSEVACEIIDRLDELLESSFGGPEADAVLERIGRVGQLEYEVDKAAYTLAKEFFRREDEIGPSPLMLWQKVIELIGRLANAAEAVGDHVRLMLVR